MDKTKTFAKGGIPETAALYGGQADKIGTFLHEVRGLDSSYRWSTSPIGCLLLPVARFLYTVASLIKETEDKVQS